MVENIKKYGLPVIVAINHFVADTENEMRILQEECEKIGVEAIPCKHWSDGGNGTVDLAKKVVDLVDQKNSFKFLYEDKISLLDKIQKIAKEIYGADEIIADNKIRLQLKQFEENGYGDFPICIAKTQYSFSTDPTLKGAPSGHSVPIRELRLSSGAEFIVVICGEIMTMPGLPSIPAADSIKLNDKGEIEGLF
jgi:Formyltetrahydrofolate synthetase